MLLLPLGVVRLLLHLNTVSYLLRLLLRMELRLLLQLLSLGLLIQPWWRLYLVTVPHCALLTVHRSLALVIHA